jgi:TonB family protein
MGVLFAVRDRRLIMSPPAVHLPSLSLSPESTELWTVTDPTLFALPRRESFSGEAWLNTAPLELHTKDTPGEPRFLQLATQELAGTFRTFVRTKMPVPFQTLVMPEPILFGPALPVAEPVPARSTLRLEGNLVDRRVLTRFELPAWNADLLSNSVVQLAVDGRGITLSATLLQSSGYKAADDLALELGRTARFAPIDPIGPARPRKVATELTLGTLVFEWRAAPVPLTNSPPP